MQFWIIQGLNSLSLGGLLFLLSSGFSLIFGLMRLANLTHGAFFMLGTYLAATALRSFDGLNIWTTAIGAGFVVAALGGLFERLVLTRLKANPLGQVLVTLGMSFIISDACLMIWGGDSIPVPTPQNLQAPTRLFGFVFPTYRLVLVGLAVLVAAALYFLIERTRLGAMIRAGVDDRQMARAVGIPVSRLFTIVFCLGTGIAGAAGVLGGPILSAYPGLDADMLPLALIVVILGGTGSLLGALVGSFVIGVLYNFGPALFPELAYVVLFLPMLLVLVLRPQGLFGRRTL
jgi:branched-chain amino acid transport system permease protein